MTVNTFIPLASAAPIVDFTPVGRQKVIERLGEEQKLSLIHISEPTRPY